jgi:hypothetical protein
MRLKNVLRNIQADRANLCHGRLPQVVLSTPPLLAHRCRRGASTPSEPLGGQAARHAARRHASRSWWPWRGASRRGRPPEEGPQGDRRRARCAPRISANDPARRRNPGHATARQAIGNHRPRRRSRSSSASSCSRSSGERRSGLRGAWRSSPARPCVVRGSWLAALPTAGLPLVVVRLRRLRSRRLRRGAYVAASGGIAAVIVAIAMSVWRAREMKRVTTYGSARWAETREIREAGLLGHDGVLLGQWRDHYLRHDGPEHVLCFAPTRSGKGAPGPRPEDLGRVHGDQR